MEMVLNKGFCEMTQDETEAIDGGFWAEVALGAKTIAGGVGAAVGLGPVGGAILLGACIIAMGAGIYAGCQ